MFHSATLAETEFCKRTAGSDVGLVRKTEPSNGLKKWLTAAVASLSLVLASTAPAQADRASDDLAKALVAALAVGALINSMKKDRVEAQTPEPTPVHRRRHVAPTVPEVCAFEINGRHRSVTVYPEQCLRREGFDYRLPRDCAFDARVFGRRDRVYPETCLEDAGFNIDGRGWDRNDRDRFDGDRLRHFHGGN